MLQKVTIKLFSMATSNAASERNFLTIGVMHYKLRDSLVPDTVTKLVSIKSNLGAFYDSPKADSDKYERNTESDVDDIEPA